MAGAVSAETSNSRPEQIINSFTAEHRKRAIILANVAQAEPPNLASRKFDLGSLGALADNPEVIPAKSLTSPSLCTTANKRVYITVLRRRTELDGQQDSVVCAAVGANSNSGAPSNFGMLRTDRH